MLLMMMVWDFSLKWRGSAMRAEMLVFRRALRATGSLIVLFLGGGMLLLF